MARRNRLDAVAILGLGRFGTSLALELMKQQIEVLAVDSDQRIVESLAGQLTQVSADTTSGEAFGSSRCTSSTGSSSRSATTWRPASSPPPSASASRPRRSGPRRSASRTPRSSASSACTTSRPEHDMGKRVAHLVAGRMLDYMEFDDGYALVKTTPPAAIVGQPLSKTEVRKGSESPSSPSNGRRRLHLRHPGDRGQPGRRHHRLRQDPPRRTLQRRSLSDQSRMFDAGRRCR